jgi:hypothetical protein
MGPQQENPSKTRCYIWCSTEIGPNSSLAAKYKATAKLTGNRNDGMRNLIIGLRQLTSYIQFNDSHAFCENPKHKKKL